MERPPFRPLATRDPSLAWPALPEDPGAQLAAVVWQLEASQWWSPEELLGQQLCQAALLLEHAARHQPFYRDRLARAGIASDAPLTPEAWARIPVLTRAELQAAGAALHSPAVPPSHGSTYEVSSSGSTGQVVTVRGTRLVQLVWDALAVRDHLWHGRDVAGRLAAIRPYPPGVADYPDGLRSETWGRSMRLLFPGGPSFMLTVTTTPAQQADWLGRVAPDYLLTYPSALRDLLLYCRDRGLSFPGLREVRTLSETLPPETRALCREVWGIPIVDGYSSQENGYLALQCPEHLHYHVQGEGVLLEVLDEGGRACRPGEVGRVVVTSLHNFATPLIRYALGDLAEVGPPCPCGRGLPVLSRILGRVRNTLIYPDGRRSWPLMGDIYHAEVPGIRQYQVIQRSLDEIELKLAVDAPLGPAEEDRLRRWLQARAGYPFAVRFSYQAEIPRGPGGKFETFRSLVADG